MRLRDPVFKLAPLRAKQDYRTLDHATLLLAFRTCFTGLNGVETQDRSLRLLE